MYKYTFNIIFQNTGIQRISEDLVSSKPYQYTNVFWKVIAITSAAIGVEMPQRSWGQRIYKSHNPKPHPKRGLSVPIATLAFVPKVGVRIFASQHHLLFSGFS